MKTWQINVVKITAKAVAGISVFKLKVKSSVDLTILFWPYLGVVIQQKKVTKGKFEQKM